MVFSSLVFLCVFLPLVLFLYMICPGKYRNFILLFASLVFYGYGEPKYILIMLFSTVFDYANGRLIEYFDNQKKELHKKAVLIISIAGNLGILFVFKYLDFAIQTLNDISQANISLFNFALPIGISFYTFQTMSYTIDVYKKKVRAQKNIISFGMYVSMFPQLIAGPIVRYEQVEKEINNRKIDSTLWVRGIERFIIGLGKKVILANQIGVLWSEISQGSLKNLSVAGAWLGAIAFTFQIYFDFSGYSDMAIGLGYLFGFTYPENFKHPYEVCNITDFWRRWHITLGSWFREYVYIPLGGNRLGMKRQIINLFVVWFLTGIWHGASWNYAIWGLYFFAILYMEKSFLLGELEKANVFVRHIYSKLLIIIGWVIFGIEDLGKLVTYLKSMFGFRGELINQTAKYQWTNYILLLIILVFACTTIPKRLINRIVYNFAAREPEFVNKNGEKIKYISTFVCTFVILIVCLSLLISGSYNPFLYFRF